MGELAIHADAVLGDSLEGLRQGRAEPAAQGAARSCYSGSSGPCVWFGSISCHRLPFLAVSIPVPSFTHPPVRRGSRDVEGARVSRISIGSTRVRIGELLPRSGPSMEAAPPPAPPMTPPPPRLTLKPTLDTIFSLSCPAQVLHACCLPQREPHTINDLLLAYPHPFP